MQLEGTIPAAFASAPHLWWQDYGYNRFSGSIPGSFMCVILHTQMTPACICKLRLDTSSFTMYAAESSAAQKGEAPYVLRKCKQPAAVPENSAATPTTPLHPANNKEEHESIEVCAKHR